MRDPKRIKPMLKLIEKIWIKNPDLRLMQLLGNVLGSGDHYYKEDDQLETNLKELYLNE